MKQCKLIIVILMAAMGPFAKADSVRLIELKKSEATCYQGKAAATASVITGILALARQQCKQMGETTVLQDVGDQLSINLRASIPNLCGGVSAHLKVNCLILD